MAPQKQTITAEDIAKEWAQNRKPIAAHLKTTGTKLDFNAVHNALMGDNDDHRNEAAKYAIKILRDIEKFKTQKPLKPAKPLINVKNAMDDVNKGVTSAKTAFGLVAKIATFVIEKSPQMTLAAATFAMLHGNIDDDALKSIADHCTDKTLSLCDNAALFQKLSDRDKIMVAALLDTSIDEREKRTIEAIATAAVKTDADLLFMLSFAQLESSMGKLSNAETSSAQGDFQYIETSWGESFKKWIKHYDGENAADYQKLAAKIKIVDGNPVSNERGAVQELLNLRHDKNLMAFITAKDQIAADPVILKHNWQDTPIIQDDDFVNLAQRIGMGRAGKAMIDLWNETNGVSHDSQISEDDKTALIAQKENMMVEKVTDAYLEHFLGKTGKVRFLALYENKDNPARYRPVTDLIGHAAQPVSKQAIESNGNIFLNGDASVVATYEIIRRRVEKSFLMMDKRVALHMDKTARQLEIKIGDTRMTLPDNIPVPTENPKKSGVKSPSV